MVYIPAGKSWKGGNFFVRANVSAHLLTGIIRAEVAASDKILQVERIQPFETVINDMISQEHLTALLSSVFAALACLLAVIGLYGVFAYSVSRRTNEFGIRIALGTQRRYAYRLTSKGNKTALLFVLFHKCVGGPLANSLSNSPPATELKPATRIEAARRKADQSIEHVLQLLAA